jgi:predicted membrane protein
VMDGLCILLAVTCATIVYSVAFRYLRFLLKSIGSSIGSFVIVVNVICDVLDCTSGQAFRFRS